MIREKPSKGSRVVARRGGVIAVVPPGFRRERALLKRGVWPVAGCDEAGRGPYLPATIIRIRGTV